MNITKFMSLGIFWLSIFSPLTCILLCHLMFKWEEKGIWGSEETAKTYIRYSLISITIRIIIAFAIFLVVVFINWQFVIGLFTLSTFVI